MFRWKWRGVSYSCGAVGSVMETDSFILLHNRILPPSSSWRQKQTQFLEWYGTKKNPENLGSVQNTRQAYCEVALLESIEAELAWNEILMMMNFKLQSYYIWVQTTDCLLIYHYWIDPDR